MKRVLVTGGTGGIGGAVVRVMEAQWDVYAPSRQELNVLDSPPLWAMRLPVHALVAAHAAPAGADLLTTFLIDVMGAQKLVDTFAPVMADAGGGSVLLFSSIRAQQPRATQVAYATAKSAIEGMTRALAVKWGPLGVRVNCVAPGAVRTPRTDANLKAGVVSEDELVGRTPTRRLTEPEEVAQMVAWLCSDAARQVNGQVLTLDGGWGVSG